MELCPSQSVELQLQLQGELEMELGLGSGLLLALASDPLCWRPFPLLEPRQKQEQPHVELAHLAFAMASCAKLNAGAGAAAFAVASEPAQMQLEEWLGQPCERPHASHAAAQRPRRAAARASGQVQAFLHLRLVQQLEVELPGTLQLELMLRLELVLELLQVLKLEDPAMRICVSSPTIPKQLRRRWTWPNWQLERRWLACRTQRQQLVMAARKGGQAVEPCETSLCAWPSLTRRQLQWHQQERLLWQQRWQRRQVMRVVQAS
jgi:hypothetical protein